VARSKPDRLTWQRGPWTGVRYRPDIGPNGEGGFEMRCAICAARGVEAYWPLDLEFWNPNKGLTKCKSCWNAYERSRHRRQEVKVKTSAEQREYKREWAARKRLQQREAEGRRRYERRPKAA